MQTQLLLVTLLLRLFKMYMIRVPDGGFCPLSQPVAAGSRLL